MSLALRPVALLLALACSAQAAQLQVLDQPDAGRTEVRVLADDPWATWPVTPQDRPALNALRTLSQVLPNPLPGVPVRCTARTGEVVETVTDDAGRAACRLPAGAGPVRVEAPQAVPQTAPVWPLAQATHLTVSDLDDTLIRTGVRQGGLWRLLWQNALTRPVFPGAAALLQAQAQRGPVVYLSNSPDGWQAPLRQLLAAHGFPAGPLWLRAFERDSGPRHKAQALDTLARQTSAQITLLGDSGEQDPELYAAFVRAWPGRVERILIRDAGTRERHAEVERLLGGLGVAWAWWSVQEPALPPVLSRP